MPFDFLKRKKDPEAASAQVDSAGAQGVPKPDGIAFDGLTEEWRLVGRMLIEGRLSDALNKREPIAIDAVSWAPVDGSSMMAPAPGLKSVDPYDLVVVFADDTSLPAKTDEERAAHRIHKVSYEVALEAPPYRVVGTILLYPGSEPDSVLQRSSEMFVPVVGATATIGGRPIGPDVATAILVNRQYLRGVEQVDARTGERHETLPGDSLGGTNWTDRAR
ncbi:MAG: hypothetical protein E4H24_00570 [Thermomicrobiales bacterium]|nr:MAG: hypothetical protein E4H24_00570 [Thermomicrobiales bacterium]